MKILIHDYAGHPFQMSLSKRLAEKGHIVTHVYFGGDNGPKGDIRDQRFPNGGDLAVRAVGEIEGYSKGNLVSRFLKDLAYRSEIMKVVRADHFDIVISGNTPTWVQGGILKASEEMRAKFVFWCQDFYSLAVCDLLFAKLGLLGKPLGFILQAYERSQFLRSDYIVHITDAFLTQTAKWDICNEKIAIIPNWSDMQSIVPGSTDNSWSRKWNLNSERVVMYSGTLGLKHNPDLILNAASKSPAKFVVIGFGVGFDKLRESNAKNVVSMGLQPFGDFSDVLATASCLVAVIEREAGRFSVPSKLLSYLCAGRPIVLAAPHDNLAAQIVRESGAGMVVEPDDTEGFRAAIDYVLSEPAISSEMGEAARRYAEENFDIDIVTSRFEEVFEKALGRVK